MPGLNPAARCDLTPVLTRGAADLSVGTRDAVKAADGLPLSDPFPGTGLAVLAAHRPRRLENTETLPGNAYVYRRPTVRQVEGQDGVPPSGTKTVTTFSTIKVKQQK